VAAWHYGDGYAAALFASSFRVLRSGFHGRGFTSGPTAGPRVLRVTHES